MSSAHLWVLCAAHLSYSEEVTLNGLGLNGTHVLHHIHVHWGDSNAKGSEHSLNGESSKESRDSGPSIGHHVLYSVIA